MGTHSVIGYKTNDGKFRGTYVHWDGYPEYILPTVKAKIAELGYLGVVDWVEAGISGQGYSSADENTPYNDGDRDWLRNVDDEEYGYIVSPDKRCKGGARVKLAHGRR